MFNLIDIVVIAIIALSAFIGYKIGFVKTVIGLLSFVIAIGVALAFYKPFAALLTENTTIDDWVRERIVKSDVKVSGDSLVIETETSEEKVESATTVTNNESTEDTSFVNTIISVIPQEASNLFNLEETKEVLKNQIADKIVELVMNVLSLIIIFVLVKVILLIANLLLGLATKVPGLKQINEIMGLLVAVLLAFAEIYIAFAIVLFISSVADISFVTEAIKSSLLASFLFENNPIIWFLS